MLQSSNCEPNLKNVNLTSVKNSLKKSQTPIVKLEFRIQWIDIEPFYPTKLKTFLETIITLFGVVNYLHIVTKAINSEAS